MSCKIALMLVAGVSVSQIDEKCTFNGHRLYGRIEVVDSFPDVTVREVGYFPHLRVEKVLSFPTKCGQWKIVNSHPDTKVKFVNAFEDVKVLFVNSFPGAGRL